jgi:hypothetical protein
VVVDDEDRQALERTRWGSGHDGALPKVYRGRPARRLAIGETHPHHRLFDRRGLPPTSAIGV